MVNTVTNEFGEFRAEVENSGDLELSLLSPGGKTYRCIGPRSVGTSVRIRRMTVNGPMAMGLA